MRITRDYPNFIRGIGSRLFRDPHRATHNRTERHIHHGLFVAHVPDLQGRGSRDGAGRRDYKTIKYTPNELGLRSLRSTFLPVPLVLTAHVPFCLPEVFSKESLI